jgi:hypothetical protein
VGFSIEARCPGYPIVVSFSWMQKRTADGCASGVASL